MIAFTQHKGMVLLHEGLDVSSSSALAAVAGALKSSGARIVRRDVDVITFEGGAVGCHWAPPYEMTGGTVRVELVGPQHILSYDVSLRGVFHGAIGLCAFVGAAGILFAAFGGWFIAAVMLPGLAGACTFVVFGAIGIAKNGVDALFQSAVNGRRKSGTGQIPN